VGQAPGFPPAPLQIGQRPEPDGRIRLILAGEVDISSADTLTQALRAARCRGCGLIIDLAHVTFLDSTGIAALLMAHRQTAAAGQTLTVVNARDIVRRVLAITGALPTLAGPEQAQPPP
jgi:anti-anti-sigma factor